MKQSRIKKVFRIVRENGMARGIKILLYKWVRKSRYFMTGTIEDALSLIYALDLSIEDYENNLKIQEEFRRSKGEIKSVNWFIPYFTHSYYGGIYTILRFASYFLKQGMKTRLVLYDNPSEKEDDFRGKVVQAFPALENAEYVVYRGPDINTIGYADISIATLWTSAYLLLKFRNTKGKFYFVQDYEPLFYPAGSYYALSEATYNFGFQCLVNTPGLYEFLRSKHEISGEYFIPAVDREVFSPAAESLQPLTGRKIRLFLYGRPGHDRNAFELAVATVKTLKRSFGERVEIISAGSEWTPSDYGLEGIVENLGLLQLEETARIYRTLDFGLVFMFTKHPSYLPLELMASGCIVITNENTANRWLFRDGDNAILVKPFPSFICGKIERILEDPPGLSRLRLGGLRTVEKLSWDVELEKIWRYIIGPGTSPKDRDF